MKGTKTAFSSVKPQRLKKEENLLFLLHFLRFSLISFEVVGGRPGQLDRAAIASDDYVACPSVRPLVSLIAGHHLCPLLSLSLCFTDTHSRALSLSLSASLTRTHAHCLYLSLDQRSGTFVRSEKLQPFFSSFLPR